MLKYHQAPDCDQAVRDKKGPLMTTLYISETGELYLTLRGAAENRILTSVRRWPHWRRVDIERDPMSAERTLSVTLVTDQIYESTVREILKRSFGMTFPADGGSSEMAPEPPSRSKRRGR
jgi:hypothetical protein